MRAAAVARVSPSSRPAAARPARLRAVARRTTGANGESGGRASGGLARVGGPTRVVCLARASSRDEGGVGPSEDDASSNERAWVAKTRVERGSNAALSVGGDDEKDESEDENEESRDAAARLTPFDVDDATSAWVLCRFAFIWVVFGYVAVPAYALLVETPVMDLSPKTQAAALLASEAGKLVATNAMLDAELGPTRTPRRRCFGKDVPFAALWNTHDVALGVACGALASVAARAADGITDGIISAGDETVAAASSSALDLFASIRGDGYVALVAAAAASALVAPAAEELFFRGFLLPAVRERFLRKNGRGNDLGNDLAAVAVVAATFAAAHFSPSDFPALFVAGAVFGAASLGSRTRGGLVAPFLAHAIFNALVLAEYLS